MRYPQELANIEADVIVLETKIKKLKKTIASKSLEIKDNINIRVENLEKEINELSNVSFNLTALLSFLIAKLTLYSKKKLLRNLKISPQKEIDKLLNREYTELQALTSRCSYLQINKN